VAAIDPRIVQLKAFLWNCLIQPKADLFGLGRAADIQNPNPTE
jgi:hypothetical protein